jgi:hypothetical protein
MFSVETFVLLSRACLGKRSVFKVVKVERQKCVSVQVVLRLPRRAKQNEQNKTALLR